MSSVFSEIALLVQNLWRRVASLFEKRKDTSFSRALLYVMLFLKKCRIHLIKEKRRERQMNCLKSRKKLYILRMSKEKGSGYIFHQHIKLFMVLTKKREKFFLFIFVV